MATFNPNPLQDMVNPADSGNLLVVGVSTNITNYNLPPDMLVLSQSMAYTFVPDPLRQTISHSITVGSTIGYSDEYQSSCTAKVSQSIGVGVDPIRNLGTDELVITQTVQGILIRSGQTSGHTGSSYVDPAAQIAYQNLAPAKTVSFTYSGTTVNLRAPDWGDRDKYEVFRVQEETRGRELIVFQDSMWPTTEVLTLQFSYMQQSDVDNLLAFLMSSIGRMVTYVDHFGRTWKGYILNPDAEVTQPTKSNRTINVQFQGTLQ